LFAATGRAQASRRTQRTAAGSPQARLAAAAALGLDGQGRIQMACAFYAGPAPYVVPIADGPRRSMCTIDALGNSPMLATGAVITSSAGSPARR
jgi:hypothetical protein